MLTRRSFADDDAQVTLTLLSKDPVEYALSRRRWLMLVLLCCASETLSTYLFSFVCGAALNCRCSLFICLLPSLGPKTLAVMTLHACCVAFVCFCPVDVQTCSCLVCRNDDVGRDLNKLLKVDYVVWWCLQGLRLFPRSPKSTSRWIKCRRLLG